MMSLKTHNILDYLYGVALLFCPYIFGFATLDPARNACLILGFSVIGYSALTRYQYSLFQVIPLGLHMALDVAVGACLILAPYVLGYSDLLTGFQLGLHFVLGAAFIGVVAFTRPKKRRGELNVEGRFDRAA